MPSVFRRDPKPILILAAAFAVSATMLVPSTGRAEAPRPARKDSNPRLRTKDAVLTASVAPAEARPGDTVVFKVTAKLTPGWHIYTYTKETEDVGPRKTRFDVFDTGGLTNAGNWTASRAPIRKKEPAFPEIEALEFYEDEVSWSFPLKVPADAAPGKKAIRCQVSYQICNEKSCAFPVAWTLPDAEVTVLGDATSAAPLAPAADSTPTASPGASAAHPKLEDGRERLKPKTIQFSASLKPEKARPGEMVTYSVTAKLDPGWHIYDYAKQPVADGPQSTQFDFFDTAGLKPAGDWTSSTAPQIKQDPSFNVLVSTFEGEVTWSLPLKVPSGLAPGEKKLRCQVAYQVCDATTCYPQFRWTLPAVSLTVLSGDDAVALADDKSEATPVARTEAAPVAGTERKAVSEVEVKAQQGIIPLMIASALGGLLALVMPCVWPMVPITVNFFVKQGQSKKGSATALAVTYCLAIIGVFTAVGVLCSFFVSATALPRLANNPWLNFGVAGLFFAFGLSLLGLFEVRLPNALLNASARGESRGGLLGVVFMALTLTITSFTCTFPVVGGLLVMASSGQFFYPIIGLATFATVLALPFFLLALSPGLLSKMPRSGDWMNSVKVVGGLVEIGAALKFLNTAEIAFVTPENAWVNAQFVLTSWVVLAAVCGFYLLGFFRTDHDHEAAKVGPGRMVIGSGFLGIALFLAPALFGHQPQGPIWDLFVGLMPPDVSNLFHSGTALAGAPGGGRPEARDEHSSDPDPAVAQRKEKRFHGVLWGMSYEEAVERSRAENKPILIDFTGVNCANCRKMELTVLPRPEVASLLSKFVTVQLYTDFVPIASITAGQRQELAEKNQERQLDLVNEPTNPFYVVISPENEVLGRAGGYVPPGEFVGFLNQSLGKLKKVEGRMAQADAAR